MEKRDSFNRFEKDTYGYFYTSLRDNKKTFFVADKYSGMYGSEILDIKLGNGQPRPYLVFRW